MPFLERSTKWIFCIALMANTLWVCSFIHFSWRVLLARLIESYFLPWLRELTLLCDLVLMSPVRNLRIGWIWLACKDNSIWLCQRDHNHFCIIWVIDIASINDTYICQNGFTKFLRYWEQIWLLHSHSSSLLPLCFARSSFFLFRFDLCTIQVCFCCTLFCESRFLRFLSLV